MALQSERTAGKSAFRIALLFGRRLGIVDYRHTVDLDNNAFVLDDHVMVIPLIVDASGFGNINQAVKASAFYRIGVRAVDLRFVACFGPIVRLIFRVKIYPRIRARRGHNVSLELKVLEVGVFHRPDIVKMAPAAISDDLSILYEKRISLFTRLPPAKALTVEKTYPAVTDIVAFQVQRFTTANHKTDQ